jgi:hypothetical protein
MNIAIITDSTENSATTLEDSVNCFFKYGNFNYQRFILKNGFLNQTLDNFDAIIIHYSCIAFPFKQFLPINAITSLYLMEFKGLKLAFIQDEHLSSQERFRYLQSIGIDHLFSVAPIEIFEILYPSSMRNFTISNVLTGYISNNLINISKKRIPLIDRPLDLVYRGRILPNWMGASPALKKDAAIILKNMNSMKKYKYSISNSESERIYGDQWYTFLKSGRVSLLTQSGSDFLDICGKFFESDISNITSQNSLVRANYHVISPRYFEYVACGNLVAMAPGSYSNIPVSGTYLKISNDLHEISQIIDFAKSKSAQTMVDMAQVKILLDRTLHYSFLVETVEKKIIEINSYGKNFRKGHSLSQSSNLGFKKINSSNNLLGISMKKCTIALRHNFIVNKIKDFIDLELFRSIKFILSYDRKILYEMLHLLPVKHIKDFFSLNLLLNVIELYEFTLKFDVDFIYSKFKFSNTWELDLDDIGLIRQKNFLALKKKLNNDKRLLREILINLSAIN